MSAEADVYTALSSSAAVGAICGDRIKPVKLPQNITLPAISFQRITADHGGSLAGDTSNKDRVYIQIDCWAKSYDDVKSLVAAVRTGMKALVSMPLDTTDFYEDETEIYRVAFDYYVWE